MPEPTKAEKFAFELTNMGAPQHDRSELLSHTYQGCLTFNDGSMVAWNGDHTAVIEPGHQEPVSAQ
jgi:hypothetical protein